MERQKFEKSLRDWANGLGFRLSSGSTLPCDFFAALGATPHRRKLWETIVEIVQPRKKIERMRKEILAARLKGFLNKSGGKEGDRFDLWERQKKLEADVKEKRKEVSNLEKSILTKSSDLILEICKLAEIEKQCEEYKEKQLVLLLYAQRQRKLINEFESIMKSSDSGLNYYEELNKLQEMWKLDEPSELRVNEKENLWERVIECKKPILDKLKHLLEETKSNEKNIFSQKILTVEEKLNTSLGELKQRMVEEALEVMVNTKEGKYLNLRIEELIRKMEEMYDNNESFNDSFYTEDAEKEKWVEAFMTHGKVLGLKSYQDFLQDEITKLDEKKQRKESQENLKKFELVLKEMEAVNDEIETLKVEKQKLSNDILIEQEELIMFLNDMREEQQEEAYRKRVEDRITSLNAAVGKQVTIFMETPLEGFRKVETSSGRKLFECESLRHCLNNYGGEWKEFFTGMLIPPKRSVSKIVEELQNRKRLIMELKGFKVKWQELVEREKSISVNLTSDAAIWEKNFKEADGILWKISFKLQQLYPEIEFLKKILKNWVEQPFRLMIKETHIVNGVTLKQYEEIYSKENE